MLFNIIFTLLNPSLSPFRRQLVKLFWLDYPGQQFATNVQRGVGWTVAKQKHCPQIITHSGKEICRHIVKPLTVMTTQLPRQTVFIQLKMMERGTAINPLKTT